MQQRGQAVERTRAGQVVGRRQTQRFGEGGGGGVAIAQRRQQRAQVRANLAAQLERSSCDRAAAPDIAGQRLQQLAARVDAGKQRVDRAQALGRVAIEIAQRRGAVGRVGQDCYTCIHLIRRPAQRAMRGVQRGGVVVQLRTCRRQLGVGEGGRSWR